MIEGITGLVYALDVFATLYTNIPSDKQFSADAVADTVEMAVHLQDIVYSFEEDRLHHYNLAIQGKYPWKLYFTEYLKVSQEEAEKIMEMAASEQKYPTLFS